MRFSSPWRGLSRPALVSLLIPLFAPACGPSQEDYDRALEESQNLQTELTDVTAARQALRERVALLEARLRALGEDVEALEGTRASLESSLTESQRALEELRARQRQAQERLATFRGILDQFRSMIEAGQLRVAIRGNRMIVELPEGVLFSSGRADIKSAGEETLRQVAAVLKQIAERDFQVGGHTDDRPIRSRRFPSNWELSSARAVNVTRFLVEEGVDPRRISAAGYADSDPVADNDTEEGRAQNRRIEIALMPKLDELPDLSALEAE